MGAKQILSGAIILGVLVGYVWPRLTLLTRSPEQRQIEQSVYYARCADARAAGAAPIYVGEAGYRSGLDGASVGIACEPYHGR
jgi:hypothetical protein